MTSDFPPLQIDYWIYTIGKKGGLYHQYVDKNGKPQGEPKRIHNSHPPIEHKALVKEWQDKYLEKKGLVLPKRYNPNFPKTPIVKTLENNTLLVEFQTKMSSSKVSKVSKKKSNNLSTKQIELLLSEVPTEQILVCDKTNRKCLLIPQSKEIVYENINKLTHLNNKFIPEWVSLDLPKYLADNYQSSVQIYYSNDINIEDARLYATERTLCEEESSSTLGFNESHYCGKESLDPLKGLLGFYCDADVSFDEGKTKHKLHIYQAGEPLAKKDFRPIYEQIFAKMFLCAITNKKITTICLQIDNCTNPIAMDEICIALLNILRNVKTISLQFIGTKSDCYKNIITEFSTTFFKNLEDAIKNTNLDNTMFANLCDMRFLLSKKSSMFVGCSSLPLHIYGLTNNHFVNDDMFVIH